VPSKKQRRRQAKERRHEYEYVYVDEEGREVEVEEAEPRPAKKEGAEKAAKTSARGGRPARKIDPPSWRKAAKRGALFGAVFVAIFLVTKPKGTNSAAIAAQGIAFALFFVPLFYFTDSMVYRSYLKRTGRAPPPRERKAPKA
jgi:hypothetical protein